MWKILSLAFLITRFASADTFVSNPVITGNIVATQSGSYTVTPGTGTWPISGSISATATPSGSYTVTPGSGTWNVGGSTVAISAINSALPSGTNTIGAATALPGGSYTVTPGSGTFAVSGTFYQTTQPVSQVGTWNVGSSTVAVNASQIGIWDVGKSTVAVSAINGALPTGTNSIGQVTANAGTNLNTSALALESGGNLATVAGAVSSSVVQANVKQMNGVTTSMGVGAIDTGTQRVAIANSTQTVTIQTALPTGSNTIGAVTALPGGSYTVTPGSGTFTTSGTVTVVSPAATTFSGSNSITTIDMSAVNLISSNSSRIGNITVCNVGSTTLYIDSVNSVTSSAYSQRLLPDQCWWPEGPSVYTGTIWVISSGSGGKATWNASAS